MVKYRFYLLLCKVVFLISTSVILSSCTNESTNLNAEMPQAERNSLIALYNATDGDNWKNNTNWLGEVGTECSWFGVMCIYNHVYSISLPLNNLKGPIPQEIGQLRALFNLKLDNNQISGEVPVELGSLVKLNALTLAFNQLDGDIPHQLGNLKELTVLSLGSNELTGDIPIELAQLVKLNTFSLAKNKLTGELSPKFAQLESVRLFALSNNYLVGEISSAFINLKKVKQFYLYNNCLMVNLDDKELKEFLKNIDASTARRRTGCANIEQEQGYI